MKKEAVQFEEKIKKFLENLGFNDVDGGRDDFLINGIRVDVCGGREDVLLVMKFKSAEEIEKKSLRHFVNIFREKIPLLKRGLSEHPIYRKYNYHKYVMVTRNIEIVQEDILFAKQDPRIYLWDGDLIDCLHDTICE